MGAELKLATTGAQAEQPGPSSLSNGHRVVVTYCAGYDCRHPITTHRVRQNVHGHREYHSLVCYSRWSPRMREVISRFPDYEQSPHGLESLIFDLKREHGVMGAAEVLKVSRSTVSYWLRKLASFRTFAGQDLDSILLVLADHADAHGMKPAADLIGVDAKTLKRALDKIPKRAAA